MDRQLASRLLNGRRNSAWPARPVLSVPAKPAGVHDEAAGASGDLPAAGQKFDQLHRGHPAGGTGVEPGRPTKAPGDRIGERLARMETGRLRQHRNHLVSVNLRRHVRRPPLKHPGPWPTRHRLRNAGEFLLRLPNIRSFNTRAWLASHRIILQTTGVRIAIVEDHVMFREVLRKVCEQELQHEVAGETGDGRSAVALVARIKPDLVLLDLHLPNLDGFGVLEEIRKVSPDSRILILSSHCDEYTVYRVEQARVQGFVDKNTNTVAALKDAIIAVAAGRIAFSRAYQNVRRARQADPMSFDKILTDRERAILSFVGESLTDDEIAARLSISVETVQKHRLNTLRKLELNSTMELVRYAREHGFTLSAPRSGDDVMLP